MASLGGEAIGLDLGSFTGICRGKPGELPSLSSIDFGKKDDEAHDIFGRAMIFFAKMFAVKPVILFVEAPVPEFALKSQTQARSTELKYGLLGIATGIARASGVRVRRCPISTVRKHFLGQGNLKSAIAKERAFQVCTTLGWNPNNFDEADAGAVWHWGCHQYDPTSVQIVDPLFLNREAVKRK